MSTLDTYDDMMNELERGEIEPNKSFRDEFFFLGRKMKRNTSNTSILSSEKSSESITPEPNECFNWELNGDEFLNNSYLETSYKKFSLESYDNSSNSFNYNKFSNHEQSHAFDNSTNDEATKGGKNKPLYHSMRDINNRSSNQNNPLGLNNSYHPSISNMQTHSTQNSNQNLTQNANYETRLNIS
jgi:hypothetical protein